MNAECSNASVCRGQDTRVQRPRTTQSRAQQTLSLATAFCSRDFVQEIMVLGRAEAGKREVVVAKLIVTFTPDYPNQNGSVLQAEWPHFVFTCHFTWEAGCVVAFRYLSGTLLGGGRWKDSTSGTKIARMPVCHARTTASLTQELDNVCGGDLKLEAESILRRRELAPDSCFNITLLHNRTIITDNVRLSGEHLSRTVRLRKSFPHSRLLHYEF